ncbi:MAG: hypothetical protein KAX11_05385 [Candidatus Aminicenantes bacterium]|nr:hypothetical protein [Candidatus Aminicenantes bacterium]
MKNIKTPQRIIKIGKQQILSGGAVVIPIILRGGYGIKHIQIDIQHDDSDMSFLRLEKTRQTQPFEKLSTRKIGNGTIRISGKSKEGIQTIGEGALLRLYFQIKTNFSSPRIVSIDEDLSEFTVI